MSFEPRDRIYAKGYGFLSFAKNIFGIHATKVAKNLSNKYSPKKFTTDAIETVAKRVTQKH